MRVAVNIKQSCKPKALATPILFGGRQGLLLINTKIRPQVYASGNSAKALYLWRFILAAHK